MKTTLKQKWKRFLQYCDVHIDLDMLVEKKNWTKWYLLSTNE